MERAVSGRRVTRSATKKEKPGGGPGSGTMPVKQKNVKPQQ